jgi:hypothetical protein
MMSRPSLKAATSFFHGYMGFRAGTVVHGLVDA